jgi:hypothetical protein
MSTKKILFLLSLVLILSLALVACGGEPAAEEPAAEEPAAEEGSALHSLLQQRLSCQCLARSHGSEL